MSYDLDFSDLAPKTLSVRIADRDYELREAKGQDSTRFRNRIQSSIIYSSEGKAAGFKNLANTESYLVSLCLFDKETNRLVPEDVIESWPSRVKTRLFKEVQRISELSGAAEHQELLAKALSEEDSPISYKELKDFVMSLPGDEYALIQVWFEAETSAKNVQRATTDGSD